MTAPDQPDSDPRAEAEEPPVRRGHALALAWAVLLVVVGGVATWLAISEPPALVPITPPGTVVAIPAAPVPPAPEPAAPPAPAPAVDAIPPVAEPPAAALATPPPPLVTERPPPPPPPAAAPPAKAPEPAAPPKAAAAPPPAPSQPAPSPPAATASLPVAPDPALLQQGPSGPLPVIAPDGRQAWQVYARPFDEADKRPRIALIVGDLGLSAAATTAAIQRLPASVTLAFAPYAHNLNDWIAQARAAGHEVMLQLPMEPLDYPASDPGPQALLTSLDTAGNLQRLEWVLSRVAGYVGVTNYMGSKFTTSPDNLRPVLVALKGRGLLFLDSRSSQRSVAAKLAKELGMPVAVNNRFVDNEASRAAIDARLDELERIAKATGIAVGIGYPYPVTIERIGAWAQGLTGRGLALAPVSAVVNRQAIE